MVFNYFKKPARLNRKARRDAKSAAKKRLKAARLLTQATNLERRAGLNAA